jgi:hypothetical protein
MMENDISYYFNKYLSDKAINGYSEVYNELFTPRRYDDIKLLEIGIGTLQSTESNMLFWKEKHESYLPGASLKAFRDYFFNGIIYGVDIQPDCMINEERIHTHLFNSRNKEMCNNIFSSINFDFIIDDGDHHYNAQIETFENLFNKLNKGGVYIIEDLAFPQVLKSYFEGTNHNYDFKDAGMIVIKNKNNDRR